MIKNYIKLALKVMRRRKFFSFISLFGISLTLMILIVVVAFLQNELGANKPALDQDKMVLLEYIKRIEVRQDTILKIDSTQLDGRMVYDTTREFSENNAATSMGPFGYKIYRDYLSKMVEPVKTTLYANGRGFDLFRNNKKVQLSVMYVDPNYWDVFDFEFLSGGPLKSKTIEDGLAELIITDMAAEKYFGYVDNIVGEKIQVQENEYTVVGVVKAATNSKEFLSANLYLPSGRLPDFVFSGNENYGPFNAVFVANSPARRSAIIEELSAVAAGIDLTNDRRFTKAVLNGQTYIENYASGIFGNYGEKEKDRVALRRLFLGVTSILLLFILLPTLNLISLNVTRILDRSSEIGVRKAFGASQGDLMNQFIFENIVITIIGGLLGFALAYVTVLQINKSRILGDTILTFNWTIFFISLLVILLFGLLSGLLPAWRMSKLPIVNALKTKG